MSQAGTSTTSSLPSACLCATAHCQTHALRSQSPSLAGLTREAPNRSRSNAQTRCRDIIGHSVSSPGWQDDHYLHQPCNPTHRFFDDEEDNNMVPDSLEELFSFESAGHDDASMLNNDHPQQSTASSLSSFTPNFTPNFTSPTVANAMLTSNSHSNHGLGHSHPTAQLQFVNMADKAACTRARNTRNSRKYRQNKVNRIRELELQLRLSDTKRLEWERRARMMGWTE